MRWILKRQVLYRFWFWGGKYGDWLLFLFFIDRRSASTDGCDMRIFRAAVSGCFLIDIFERGDAADTNCWCGTYFGRRYVWGMF